MSGSEGELRRLRWSVPAEDVSTNRWLDAQRSISGSMRLLIREAIRREGYIDVVNKPVEQQPRRGRPPKNEIAGAIRPVGDVDPERGREMVREALIEHFDCDPADAERAAGEIFASQGREQTETETEPPQPASTPSPDPGLDEGGQLDINALMANRS